MYQIKFLAFYAFFMDGSLESLRLQFSFETMSQQFLMNKLLALICSVFTLLERTSSSFLYYSAVHLISMSGLIQTWHIAREG